MRFSQQRETIKNVVRGTNSHPTAEWVYTQTKKVIPNISLGTVYRNLKTLQETGQINVIHDGPVARYDWNLEALNQKIRQFSTSSGIEFKIIAKTIREIMTRNTTSLGVSEILYILGKKACISRIKLHLNS